MVVSGLITAAIPIVFVKLLALNAIQGAYIPAIQAAVPAIVAHEKLTSGNAVVGIVNSLANLAGPTVAAIFYARFGLYPILIFCAVCYVFTAVADLFIRIPYKKQAAADSIFAMVKSDLTLAVRFIVKEKPIILNAAITIFLFMLLSISLLLVGFPILVVQNLEFDMNVMGVAQAVMMAGGFVGGIAAGVWGERFSIRSFPMFLAVASFALVPMGVVFLFNTPTFATLAVITLSGAVIMFINTMLVVVGATFIQKETPSELIGKVMAVIMMLPFLATALGQIVFGVVFEWLAELPWVVVLGAAVLSFGVVLYSLKHMRCF